MLTRALMDSHYGKAKISLARNANLCSPRGRGGSAWPDAAKHEAESHPVSFSRLAFCSLRIAIERLSLEM